MKKHTQIYFNYFGYKIPEDVFCEICGSPAKDIHHIESRGMGGDPIGKKDTIQNLMALCRTCHVDYGDVVKAKSWLKRIHNKKMKPKNYEKHD